jgi:predicted small secreted protein
MKPLLLIALATAIVLTSSCNTFIGMGRDLRLTGEGMEKTAGKAQTKGSANTSGADNSGVPVY